MGQVSDVTAEAVFPIGCMKEMNIASRSPSIGNCFFLPNMFDAPEMQDAMCTLDVSGCSESYDFGYKQVV